MDWQSFCSTCARLPLPSMKPSGPSSASIGTQSTLGTGKLTVWSMPSYRRTYVQLSFSQDLNVFEPEENVAHAQLDTGEALRAVDMGPPAESPKAAAFREFWGDRAELRRYKVCPMHILRPGNCNLLAGISLARP